MRAALHQQLVQSWVRVRSSKIFLLFFHRIPPYALFLTQDSWKTKDRSSPAVPWPLLPAPTVPQMLSLLALGLALISRSEMKRRWKPRPDSSPPEIWRLRKTNLSCALHQRPAAVPEGMQSTLTAARPGESFSLALRVIDPCKETQKVLNSWVLFWYYLLDYFGLSGVLNVKVSNVSDSMLQAISNSILLCFFCLNSRTRSLWFLRGTLGGVTQENGPLLLAFIPVDSSLRGMSTHGPEPNPLHFLLTQSLENNYMQL